MSEKNTKAKKQRKLQWYKTQKEIKTKGYIKKTEIYVKEDNKAYTLQEIKDMCKTFDNYAKENKGKYFLLARNEYRSELTIRSYNGTWYDEDDDYYNARGFEKDKFEKFYQFQVVYTKPV